MTQRPAIAVYCDDESTRTGRHRGRVVQVATFYRDDPGAWYSRQPRVEQRGMHDFDRTDPGRKLYVSDDGRAVGYHPKHAETTPDVGIHETYRLRCELCRLEHSWRASRLAPILDQLQHADQERVSLRSLAMLLSSSTR